MTANGYAGEILKIDLSAGTIDKLPTSDYAGRFIGGKGIAARLYWELVPPQTGAFDAENAFICVNGPLAGLPDSPAAAGWPAVKPPPVTPSLFPGETWEETGATS
jgi:aldehyde:ferredoxin oxidoreductase